jgi:hypothetical protein
MSTVPCEHVSPPKRLRSASILEAHNLVRRYGGGTATAANTHPRGSDVHITLPQA